MDDVPALVDFAVDIAEVLFDESISDAVRSLRFEALREAHGRAVYFAKQGFPPMLTDPVYQKRAAFIKKATSKTEIKKVLAPPKPHDNGNKVVSTSPYSIDEEELMIWSQTFLLAPLCTHGANRFMELFEKFYHISEADLSN